MLDLDSLPPILADSPSASAERQLFMHALEYAVLLSANTGNQSDFQRYMSCLHPYHSLFRGYAIRSASFVFRTQALISPILFLLGN